MERVYTDGSTDRNGSEDSTGGMGVWFGPGDDRNIAAAYEDADRYGPPTNQKCELLAIALALESSDHAVCIVTDSKYAIGCLVDWLPGWKRRGWKNSQGKPVKNREIIERAAEAMDRTGSVIEHTPGHATGTDPDTIGNNMADELANRGREKSQQTQKLSKKRKREQQVLPTLDMERSAWTQGKLVIGVDEVGRGCLAGPVTVCATVLPVECDLEGLKDSKKLTKNRRAVLMDCILDCAETFHVASRTAEQIDAHGILNMTLDAMREAVQTCHSKFNNKNVVVLVDGTVEIPDLGLPQITVPQGDSKSRTIAAASIVAKQVRDSLMISMEDEHGYGFAQHKGYGTKMHYEKLEEHGPSKHHRTSFRLQGGYRKK